MNLFVPETMTELKLDKPWPITISHSNDYQLWGMFVGHEVGCVSHWGANCQDKNSNQIAKANIVIPEDSHIVICNYYPRSSKQTRRGRSVSKAQVKLVSCGDPSIPLPDKKVKVYVTFEDLNKLSASVMTGADAIVKPPTCGVPLAASVVSDRISKNYTTTLWVKGTIGSIAVDEPMKIYRNNGSMSVYMSDKNYRFHYSTPAPVITGGQNATFVGKTTAGQDVTLSFFKIQKK